MLTSVPHPLRVLSYKPKRYSFNRFCHRLVNLLHPEKTMTPRRKIDIHTQVIVPDTSLYEGHMNVWQTASAGAMGIIAKASQGNYSDPQFRNTWQGAKGILPRGSYHFYDPQYSPTAQLTEYISLLHDDPGELPITVDWEYYWTGSWTGWKNLYAVMEGLKTAFPKKRLMIYTGYYYWLDHSPNPITQPASLAYFGQYDLWLAWYTENFSIVRIPRPWVDVKYLQFTESGNGELFGAQTKGIDLSYYNGTQKEYVDEYHLGGSVEPEALVSSFTIRRKNGTTQEFVKESQ